MVDAVSFRTRARTIDHLGREQIADCPTAISELWKNAYDAYSSTVALHIYDETVPVAAIVDDGHGMSKEEFISKWLVVGTESKNTNSQVPEEDRNGLVPRPKQGQKGIGRLSSAFLGPLLLVVSKRRNQLFTASLIDWRLFENPFIYLEDIEIPVVEFERKEEIFANLPSMVDSLRGNWQGNGQNTARDERIKFAWQQFDLQEAEQGIPSTRAAMDQLIDALDISDWYFSHWPLWQGEKEHGTILIISDIVFDLQAQLEQKPHTEDEEFAERARDLLFQTLSNFTDPYANPEQSSNEFQINDFNYSVTAWEENLCRLIISNHREFDYSALEELEHVVDGRVDEQGGFTGRIKAFGQWLDDVVTIPSVVDVPTRSNSKVGAFDIRLGTFQIIPTSSTHPPEVHQKLCEQAEQYAGLMLYRNGLRVMPYGREDNDFFKIDSRRSKNAGRYFWSNRRIFGRVSIGRNENPNLKDKAGREGLIDNTAVKAFKNIVIGILTKTAFDYFGSNSELQKKYLPEIEASNRKKIAEEARKKQRTIKQKKFRANLQKWGPELDTLVNKLESLKNQVRDTNLANENDISSLRTQLYELKGRIKDFSLGEAPKSLGSMEEDYGRYRSNQRSAAELVGTVELSLNVALEAINPPLPRDTAYADLSRHAAFIQNRLKRWHKEVVELLESEQQRIAALYADRSKQYHAVTLPLLDDVEHGRIPLGDVLARLSAMRESVDAENAQFFEPYIAALQSLKENIDLETLASYSAETADEMRDELSRLHALAQLGITVEVIGHEIQGFELTISEGLDQLPESLKQTNLFRSIITAHQSLVDRLRFLSPLKLSGSKSRENLSGREILDYVHNFFRAELERSQIALEASDKFLRFTVYELASRIYPVFINLINNAIYWVKKQRNPELRILLDVVDGKVVVADNGSGVDEADQKQLFSLFFTRKISGGRGVGLYLCRANLAAGGHTIRYATEKGFQKLTGANFVIDFKGAKYD